MNLDQLKSVVEGLLLVSGKGLSEKEVSQGLSQDIDTVRTVLESLVDDYLERDGGVLIKKIKGKYQFVTHTKIFNHIRDFVQEKKKDTLSKSMLETLAIITYKQPITLHELEEVRGVNSRSMVMALMSKKLVKTMGQKEAPGRPTLYGTTKEFLEYLGLNSLEDLPAPSDVKELDFEEL